MIEIKEIWFSYGENTVLQNISMTFKEGCIYGLLGENGVGKTTLLTLVCGLKKPQCGTIDMDGRKPYDREPSLLSGQYFLSDDVAPVNMKACDYAASYGKFWEKFSMDKFLEIMNMFETDPQQKMSHMSAGQLKKTYISFALSCSPSYLILDEPTNGLDPSGIHEIRNLIKRISVFTKKTFCFLVSIF